DVHDIGKNIVGVVLACNNYEIIDLGVMVPAQKIIEEARAHNVDVIGLSGLITPSLDEMAHLAAELQRENFHVPLLIGGATTSRVHTAVKIWPHYTNAATVHVNDASRAVGVVSALLSEEQKAAFEENTAAEYIKLAEAHARGNRERKILSLEQARANRFQPDWASFTPTTPTFTGTRILEDWDLAELARYIDWTPFFQTWDLKGRYPALLDDAEQGAAARQLFDDAQAMLQQIIAERWFKPKAICGFWPANARMDDIICYADASRSQELAVLHTLRQQRQRREGHPNLALADFVAPVESGKLDYIGGFVVTAGIEEVAIAERFERANDDYSSIMVKALADRFAEAMAEVLHLRVRTEFWPYAADEALSVDEVLLEKFRGIRPAPGYPAQPDHTEKRTLFRLLDSERSIGVRLTESDAMWPGSSVSGLYFSHAESAYFGVGPIGADQVADYARRKGLAEADAQRLLSTISS
ncbi:MAG: methionine synthase, partial [Beijerinckiaceae bacterium]|nr:methionine synthase [Beijerinckiaceae bacterium]